MVTAAAVTLLLAGHALAQDIPTREAREKAPNFAFFATRSKQIVLFRDDPALRRQVQQENAAYGQNLEVRVLAGRPVLVAFWGPKSFCGGCEAKMEVFQKLHEEFALDEVQVVGLGFEVPSRDTDYAKKFEYAAGPYRYTGKSAAETMGLNNIPSWALIDKNGEVFAKSESGITFDYIAEQIRKMLRPAR